MKIEELYKLYLQNPSVQTDTRKLTEGDIFFALKGPNFNGNQFAEKALTTGAAYVIVDEKVETEDNRIIQVEDSLKTLQELASYHRDHFKIPFLAITGSNGKTTTKELIHAVLSTHYRTYTTEGNLNNHIGIPLTILRIREDAQIAVIEMGANHQHEIESYCTYAKPDYGLITNIGKAHLEGFGGEEGVKKGKGELFAYLSIHSGTAFVNAMDAKIMEVSEPVRKKVYYGGGQNGIMGEVLESDPFLKVGIEGGNRMEISTRLVGKYNLSNVLAAAAVGRYFQVPDEKIIRAIEGYAPTNSRSQMIKKYGNTIIMDAYNANPSSMKAAIENFAAMKGENKVLILGAMKELGKESLKEHEQLVELIGRYKWKEVALTGIEFSNITHEYQFFENEEQTRKWFLNSSLNNCLILVKGSRSMQMEKVVN